MRVSPPRSGRSLGLATMVPQMSIANQIETYRAARAPRPSCRRALGRCYSGADLGYGGYRNLLPRSSSAVNCGARRGLSRMVNFLALAGWAAMRYKCTSQILKDTQLPPKVRHLDA